MPDEEPRPKKLSAKHAALIAAAVAVVAILSVLLFRYMRWVVIDGALDKIDRYDVVARDKAITSLKAKSARSGLVTRVILENLAEDDVDIGRREALVALLIEIGDDNTIATLVQALGDPKTPEAVRSGTIDALSELRDPRSAQALVDTLGKDKEGERAAEGLVTIGKISVPALIKVLGHTNALVRRRAAATLGRIGDPSAVEPLGKVLGDEDPAVRLAAVESLVAIGGDEVVPVLAKALVDADLDVRRAALDALENMDCAKILENIAGVLGDADPHMRIAAARILGKLGDARAVKSLLGALIDKDPAALRAVVSALAKLGDPSCVEPLIALLGHEDGTVRRTAITALGGLGDARALEPILACQDAATVEAVEAYGAFKDARAVPKLVDILVTDLKLVDNVTNALIKIDDPSTLELVETAFETCTYTEEKKAMIIDTLTTKQIKAVATRF